MAEVKVKIGADSTEFSNTIRGVEQQLRNMRREFAGADVGSARFNELKQSIGQTEAHLGTLRGGFAKLSGRGRGSIGDAALQMAYFADDVQYGVRGIVNNIPLLLMSLGAGTGLTGVVSIAAVGLAQLAKHFGKAKEESKQMAEAEQKATEATEKFNSVIEKQNTAMQRNVGLAQERVTLMQAEQRSSTVGESQMDEVEKTAKQAERAYEVEKQKQTVIAAEINGMQDIIKLREQDIKNAQAALDADDEAQKKREKLQEKLAKQKLRSATTSSAGGFGPGQAQAAKAAQALQDELAKLPEALGEAERKGLQERIDKADKEISSTESKIPQKRAELRTQQERTRGTRLLGAESVIAAQIEALRSKMKQDEQVLREKFAPEAEAGFGNYVESLVIELRNNGQQQIKTLQDQIDKLSTIEQNTRAGGTAIFQ